MHIDFGFGIGFGMHIDFGFGIITSFGFGLNFVPKSNQKPKFGNLP